MATRARECVEEGALVCAREEEEACIYRGGRGRASANFSCMERERLEFFHGKGVSLSSSNERSCHFQTLNTSLSCGK